MPAQRQARTTCPTCNRTVPVSRHTELIRPHGEPTRCPGSGQRIDLYGGTQ